MNAEEIIRSDMPNVHIYSISQLGKRIGIDNRSTMNRKVKMPTTFTINEIQALAKLLGWSDKRLGEFIRSI